MKSFFFLLLSIPALATAQGYQPGYVLLVNGDTVKGTLKHPFGNQYGLRFKDLRNEKKEFADDEILGFYIDKEGMFKKVFLAKDSMVHMVKVFEEGFLSYYEVQLGPSISSYYHILKKKTGEQFWWDSDLFSGYKSGILKFLADDAPLCEKIKHGDYSRRDILKSIEEYNQFHSTVH